MIGRVLNPYSLLVVVAGLAIVNLWRRRRKTRGRLLWISVPFAVVCLLSLPATSYLALRSLESRHPPAGRQPSGVQAIVVLAGNVSPPDATRRRAELGHASLYRCLHAAELFHEGAALPILVSGGKVSDDERGPCCASLMRDFLVRTGIDPSGVVVEGRSRSTYENAVE